MQDQEYDYKDWQFGFLSRNNFDQALKVFRQGKGHLKSLVFFPWYSDICTPPRFMGGQLGLEHLHTKYVPATIVMEVYEVVATISMMAFVSAKEYVEETKKNMKERLEKKIRKKNSDKNRLTVRYEKHMELIEQRGKECTQLFDIICKTFEVQRTRAKNEYEDIYRALEASKSFCIAKGFNEPKLFMALNKSRMHASSRTLGMWISETEAFYHKTLALADYLRAACDQKRMDKGQFLPELMAAPFDDSIYPNALMRDPAVPLTYNFRVIPYDELPEKVRKVGREITEKVSRYLGEINDRMQKAKENNIGTENPMDLPDLVIINKDFEPMLAEPVVPVEPGEEDGGVSIDGDDSDGDDEGEETDEDVTENADTVVETEAVVKEGQEPKEIKETVEIEEEKKPEETVL